MDLLRGLTKEQSSAVTHVEGPVLVVAGAGTGKTTVITRRIAWLTEEGLAKPEEILALTFTEKAATEMLSRVDDLSDKIYAGLSISTFHSFGADLISEFAFELGLPADFKVLTDVEQILFMRDHIFDFEFEHYRTLADPTSFVSELLKVFSRLKDENIIPDEFVAVAENKLKVLRQTRVKPDSKGSPSSVAQDDSDESKSEEAEKQLEIAKAFKKYNQLLRTEGYIDYGDQINLVLELLKKPSLSEKIKKRFKFALIDEYQDTNFSQNQLVYEIFGEAGNVMVVGDDDQSIYKFRGAAVSNILNFKDQYKNVKTIILRDNFRSTQEILDHAYKLIQNNNPGRLEAKYGIDKKLVSAAGKGKKPNLLLFSTESEEAEAITEVILKGKKEGREWSTFAVLFRGNKQAAELLNTFKKHSIPFVFSGAAGLYERQEVKMLVSLVSALNHPEDDLPIYHLALSDVYNMNVDDLAKISHWSAKRNIPLARTLADLSPLFSQLSLDSKTVILGSKIISDLSSLREEAKNSSAGEVVNLFLRESGYYSKLTKEAKEGSVESHNKISNIAAFFDKIIHFQRNYKDHSLKKFADYLDLMILSGDDPKPFEPEDGLDAVTVLTIHKAKGLEFETVFVSSLSDSHIPGRNFGERIPIAENLIKEKVEEEVPYAEERRLFYVAVTRAKKELYLTTALDYGTKKTHKISRFVVEMMGDGGVKQEFLKSGPIERIKHFEKVAALSGVALEPIPEKEKIILSRASIDDFLTCPFKYQLIHVTPIRIMADARVGYGNSIHNAIGEYYKRRLGGHSVKLAELLKWFDLFWDEAGFLSKVHEQKRYEAGKEALTSFYRRAEKEPLPESIEKEFKFNIGNSIIKGRYDAIFRTKEGVEIYDFKTSNVGKQTEADERTKKSTQLATYALSFLELTGQLPSSVHLYFVENGLIGTFVPSPKDAEDTKKEIEKAIEGIRSREYKSTPNLLTCRWCPFRFYCPDAILEKKTS